jgi:hypothetical protein
VILSGPDATDIIRALDDSNDVYGRAPTMTLQAHGKTDIIYALRYYAYGEININTDVNITSDVNYQVTEKKNHVRDISFKHKEQPDVISTPSRVSHFESFELISPDFKSKSTETIVVVASHNNNQESSRIAHMLSDRATDNKILHCHVLMLPSLNSDSKPSWNHANVYCPMGNVVYNEIQNFSPYKFAKCLQEELTQAANKYIESLVKDVETGIKNEIIDEFATSLRGQADKYFEENQQERKCSIM